MSPRVPTNLRLLRGDPGKGKSPMPKDEPQPRIPELVPDPPPMLEGYAAEEWSRVATELHRLRLLTVVDINALAAYCDSYRIWREATELIRQQKNLGAPMRGMVWENEDNGKISKHPLMGIAREAAQDMLRFANEFGLSPCARARISSGPYGETRKVDKFDGLIPS
jgi:P27 family predicted phage terminase small subunit